MKTKIFIRALAALLVLTAATTTFSSFTTTGTAHAALRYPDGTGGIWNSEVISYLKTYGYLNIVITNIDQYGNRTSTSSNHVGYHTFTYVSGGAIIGHEDAPDNN